MACKVPDVSVYLRVQDDLRVLIEYAQAPEDVADFILDHWAGLLADISQSKGEMHPDWQAGWETVHALLWSLTPKQSPEDSKHLLQLLPLLVERLHDGCVAMQLDQGECDAFFAQLAMLHAATLRAGAPSGGLSGDTATDIRATPELSLSRVAAMPRAAARRVSANEPTLANDAGLGGLQTGWSIEVTEGNVAKRLRLQWVSPMRGMFLFVDASGTQALSLTRAKLKERLSAGELRILAEGEA